MKKRYLWLLPVLLLVCLFRPATATTPSADQLKSVTLEEVKADIKAKKDFYLFVGRTDNRDAQLALAQLQEVSQTRGISIHFLDLKTVPSRSYKSFSKKYSIRSHAYLAHFSGGGQAAVYRNDWSQDVTGLIDFLTPKQP